MACFYLMDMSSTVIQYWSLLGTRISMQTALHCSNCCNGNPAQNDNCYRQSDFFQRIYNGRIELKRMRVIDSARVLSVQNEGNILHGRVATQAGLEIGRI